MANSRSRSLSSLEKLNSFLELDENELSSMSSTEVEQELIYMGVDVNGLKSQIQETISEMLEGNVEGHTDVLVVRNQSDMNPALPILGEQRSGYLVSTVALGKGTDEQSEVKEIDLSYFLSECVLAEKLTWIGPKIRILRSLDDKTENLARYIAYVDIDPNQKRHTHLLRVVLGTAEGSRGEVLLSCDSPSGIFSGDLLPADWDLVHIQLFVEPIDHGS